MSGAIQTLKEIISSSDSSIQDQYHCTNCGHDFESAKDPDRAQCPECLDHGVELAD